MDIVWPGGKTPDEMLNIDHIWMDMPVKMIFQ